MNKEVTKKKIRGIFAVILSALMLAGVFFGISALADGSSTEEITVGGEENKEESSCVVLRADELINKLYAPNSTSWEISERDGVNVVDLTVTNETNDAFVHLDLKGYRASRYVVVLTRSYIGDFTNFSIYYHTSARGGEDMGLGEDARKASGYDFGNGWQFLEFDMKNEECWGGSIYTVRLDYLERSTFAVGTKCEIAAIILADDVQSVNDAAYELMTEIYAPTQTLSNFKDSDIAYFISDSSVNTEVEVSEGSLVYRFVEEGGNNDPQAMFDYLGYAQANGMAALTTDDFRYTVIRYKAPSVSSSVMELFTLTGSATSLMDMIRIEGSYACHSARASYSRAVTWSAMMLDMAEDDGLEENTALKYGWYREDGDRTFKGFRADWCTTGMAGCYMEISDFMFYQDADAASGMAFALSSLTVGEDVYWGGDADDTTEESGTEGFLPPWETEEATGEETTEETIPEYVNTDEETTEETTEALSQEETSSNEELGSEITIIPGNEGGTDDEFQKKSSETPFYVACGTLAALSIASIVTVIVIKIKEKKRIE